MLSANAGTSSHALVRLSVNEWCVANNASRATAYRKIKKNELNTERLGERMLRIVVRASDLIDIDAGTPSPSIADIRAAIKEKGAKERKRGAGSGKAPKCRAGGKGAR